MGQFREKNCSPGMPITILVLAVRRSGVCCTSGQPVCVCKSVFALLLKKPNDTRAGGPTLHGKRTKNSHCFCLNRMLRTGQLAPFQRIARKAEGAELQGSKHKASRPKPRPKTKHETRPPQLLRRISGSDFNKDSCKIQAAPSFGNKYL